MSAVPLPPHHTIGAFIIRIGFGGVYYTTITTRNPQNPIPVLKDASCNPRTCIGTLDDDCVKALGGSSVNGRQHSTPWASNLQVHKNRQTLKLPPKNPWSPCRIRLQTRRGMFAWVHEVGAVDALLTFVARLHPNPGHDLRARRGGAGGAQGGRMFRFRARVRYS